MRRFVACTRRCRIAAACARAFALAAAAAARVLAAVAADVASFSAAALWTPFLACNFARNVAAARWPRSTRTGSFAHEMVKNSSIGAIVTADRRHVVSLFFSVVLLLMVRVQYQNRLAKVRQTPDKIPRLKRASTVKIQLFLMQGCGYVTGNSVHGNRIK
jgi:hypothetical protein